MKTLFPLLLACALALPSFAEEAKTNAAPAKAQTVATFSVSSGTVTKPLVLTNGYVSQDEQTEVAGGGKATFTFTLTNAGTYVIRALVNAPAEDANSFFLNIDAQPEDPTMIWDIDVTNGFEERLVSWRGNGDPSADEFSPKRFTLAAGEHKLFVVGREAGAELKSISIQVAGK